MLLCSPELAMEAACAALRAGISVVSPLPSSRLAFSFLIPINLVESLCRITLSSSLWF